MVLNAWNLTDIGCVRAHNEDSCFAQSDGEISVGVVCDGMGGANAGEVASKMALDSFLQVLQSRSDPPRELLRQALDHANRTVFCHGWEHPDCCGMGTTLVAALVMGSESYILNVGDSRAYSIRAEGIRQITRDHSLVGELLRAGQLTPEQARNHPRKNIITRALGTDQRVTGDLFLHKVTPGEFLLLCSDGLSNELTDETLQRLVLDGPAEEGCRRLIDAALAQGAHDNVTAVLIQIRDAAER